jgi:glycine C-acetyltransferase
MVVKAGIRMFEMMDETTELQDRLHYNTEYFISRIIKAGFDVKPTQSAICAVMLYDAKLSQDFAARLLDEGIYVIGFYYPVVPQGQARIRVQLSAAHKTEHLDKAIEAFIKVGKETGVLR